MVVFQPKRETLQVCLHDSQENKYKIRHPDEILFKLSMHWVWTFKTVAFIRLCLFCHFPCSPKHSQVCRWWMSSRVAWGVHGYSRWWILLGGGCNNCCQAAAFGDDQTSCASFLKQILKEGRCKFYDYLPGKTNVWTEILMSDCLIIPLARIIPRTCLI